MILTYVVSAELPDDAPAARRWKLTEALEATPGVLAIVDATDHEDKDLSERLREYLAHKAARAEQSR